MKKGFKKGKLLGANIPNPIKESPLWTRAYGGVARGQWLVTHSICAEEENPLWV